MTVTALTINDKKKQTCQSRMYNYKNLHSVVSELAKF